MILNERKIFIPKGNKKIPRRNMPQFLEDDYSGLLKFLRKKGIAVKNKSASVKKLKPTQKEISIDAVARLVDTKSKKLERPFLISKDGYILDGHHRWLALLQMDEAMKVKAFEIGLDVMDALNILREFPKVVYKDTSNRMYKEPDEKMKMESMTERERVLQELRESLGDVDAGLLDATEYDIIVYDTIDRLEDPLHEDRKRTDTYKSFSDFMTEARRKNNYDDPNEKIAVSGFGMVKVGDLEKLLESRFKDMDKFRRRKDWRNVRYLLKNTAIIPLLDALKTVEDAQND